MNTNKFSEILHNLPSNQVGTVREQILTSTGKTRQTLYNWLKPVGAITPSLGDQQIICAVLAETIGMDIPPALLWDVDVTEEPINI